MKVLKALGLSVALVVAAGTAYADSDTWSGAVSNDWADSSNWVGGNVPGNGDTATFSGSAVNPYLNSYRGVDTVNFETAGWTISGADGSGLNLRSTSAVISSGAGVNTIDVPFNDQYVDDMTFQANAGNTLVMTSDFTQRRGYVTTGAGTVIFNGNSTSRQQWNLGAGTTLFNGSESVEFKGSPSVAAGSILGGTTPELNVYQYGHLSLEDGASISPGADGVFGEMIHTMTFASSSSTVRAYVDMGGSSSSLIMDIGDTAGVSDQIVVDLSASNGYFNLMDCELALRGGATPADGDYTIITELSGNYAGVFGKITYNGVELDPSQAYVTYNDTEAIVTLNGVPEPTTISLLAIAGLAAIRRRR